jgi:N-methylhydantoinase A/oxoprolinase/acetone carboxylase beta subunit
MLVGIDVGGTYTDAVLLEDSTVIRQVKVASEHGQVLASILTALDEILQGVEAKRIERVALSTTLVTNAIVQGKLAPVGLFVMPGPGADWQGRLAAEPVMLSGYVDHRGRERQEVDRNEVKQACRQLADTKLFAVSGKFSVRNPAQEQKVAAILTAEKQPWHIACGAMVSGSLNFIRRTNSAYYNAAVWPRFRDFADAVSEAMAARGIGAPILILKADGGTLPLAKARELPVESIFTGPAASALGVLGLCPPAKPAVSLDIGGTTTDIALWKSGAPVMDSKGAAIDGYLTAVRTFRLQSIGLGGDSWVRRDGDELLIGQERKGSAMALGGPEPTVTDALIVAGLSDFGDRGLAEAAMQRLLFPGKSLQETALAIMDQAAEFVAAAVREMLAVEAAAPVYKVEDIIRPELLRPELLIGVGGGAAGLTPLIAEKLKLAWQVPPLAMVANALGAALARPTLHISLRADTAAGEYTVPELGLRLPLNDRRYSIQQASKQAAQHLQEMAASAGVTADEIETTFAEEFNLVRGFSTVGKIVHVGVQIKPGIIAGLTDAAAAGGAGE